MTLKQLRSYTCKELSTLAKKHQIPGWSSMRKDELVNAIRKVTKNQAAKARRDEVKVGKRAASPISEPTHEDVDSILVRELDPRWVQVQWTISHNLRSRAQVALGAEWHQSRLVLRLIAVAADDPLRAGQVCVSTERVNKNENSWCMRIDDPQGTYRIQLGYQSPSGRFFTLSRSRKVRTAKTFGQSQAAPMTEEELQNTSTNGGKLRRMLIADDDALGLSRRSFPFNIQAELLLRGEADPGADLTVLGSPVERHRDGSFTLQVDLEGGRQVIPAIAVAPDGRSQRTIVVAVECNAKELEPNRFDED